MTKESSDSRNTRPGTGNAGRRTGRISIRSRMLLLFLSMILFFGFFMIVNNAYAFSVIRENTLSASTGQLRLFMNLTDQAFEGTEQYLYGLQNIDTVSAMQHPASEVAYYRQLSRLKTDLGTYVQGSSYIDDLFIYMPRPIVCTNQQQVPEQFAFIPNVSAPGLDYAALKSVLTGYIHKNTASLPARWEPVSLPDDSWYLVRVFRIRNLCIGAVCSVDRLLSELRPEELTYLNFMTYYANGGRELGHVFPEEAEDLQIRGEEEHFVHTMAGYRYLTIVQPSRSGDYSLVTMIQENSLYRGREAILRVLFYLLAAMAVYLALYNRMIHRWILLPVHELYQGMREVRDGAVDVRLRGTGASPEFALVEETFNEMLDNLRDLQIDVYEQRISRQRAELSAQDSQLQYLQLQIKPHFYINCLNIINNLAVMNKLDMIREMTSYLGNHLRYTLNGNSLEPLSKELDYVENYLALQKMNFPDSFSSYTEVDPELLNVLVPPLSIQTFAENTIKHQVVAGEHLDLYIAVTKKDAVLPGADGPVRCLRIEVWDTGEGFSDEMLAMLNGSGAVVDSRGIHIGIRNVMRRLDILYEGRAVLRLSNHWETGGAYVEILLPVQR